MVNADPVSIPSDEQVGQTAFQVGESRQATTAGARLVRQNANIVDVVTDERHGGGLQVGENQLTKFTVGQTLAVADHLQERRLGVEVVTLVPVALACELHAIAPIFNKHPSRREGLFDDVAHVRAQRLACGNDRRDGDVGAVTHHVQGQVVGSGSVGTQHDRAEGVKLAGVRLQILVRDLDHRHPKMPQ